jgi:hypothetical protein
MLLIDILLIILALFFLLRQISSAGAAFTDTEGLQLRMQAGIWETSTPTPSLVLGKNCTYSAGFWKNHPEVWPVENIVMGGVIVDLESGLELLATPIESEHDRILSKQLLATKLNALLGAETIAVSEVLAQAVKWLTIFNDGGKPERETAISLAETLDAFNRGQIGPGICDDDPSLEENTPRELLEETPVETPTVESTPTAGPSKVETPQPTDAEVLGTEMPTPESTAEATSTPEGIAPTAETPGTTEVTEQIETAEPTGSVQPSPSATGEATSEVQPTPVPSEQEDPEEQVTPTESL